MKHPLLKHPNAPCDVVSHILVELRRTRPERLELSYTLSGLLDAVSLPQAAAPSRGNELWRHTCFEVFLKPHDQDAYFEFNFSPSREWAAYQFTDYREGMNDVATISAPQVCAQESGDEYQLRASLMLDRMPQLTARTPWRVGVSAVIEDTDGEFSYWALSHPPGKPDFHHSDCFVDELILLEDA